MLLNWLLGHVHLHRPLSRQRTCRRMAHEKGCTALMVLLSQLCVIVPAVARHLTGYKMTFFT